MYLYHLTDEENLASICEHGLSPDFSREPTFRARAIYFACDTSHSLGYENHHDAWKGRGVLLRVSLTHLDPQSLLPDDVDLPDLDENWAVLSYSESLTVSGQCRYVSEIPASLIQVSEDRGASWRDLGDDHTSCMKL